MSPLPMLRLNTRIGGSDSTPTTAFAGPRRCRFRGQSRSRSCRRLWISAPRRRQVYRRRHAGTQGTEADLRFVSTGTGSGRRILGAAWATKQEPRSAPPGGAPVAIP